MLENTFPYQNIKLFQAQNISWVSTFNEIRIGNGRRMIPVQEVCIWDIGFAALQEFEFV